MELNYVLILLFDQPYAIRLKTGNESKNGFFGCVFI